MTDAEHLQDERTADLGRRLAAVQRRIAAAVEVSGRQETPELVVVTKFHPAADVRRLFSCGVRHVGENRDQEARGKASDVADLAEAGLAWHFIGQLQSNKAKYVVRYASAVHSVDRASLVEALSSAMDREQGRRREAGERLRPPMDCLIQVDLDDRGAADRPAGIGSRGGAHPDEVSALATAISHAEGLRLRGVMAVAPVGLDPVPAFELLRQISGTVSAAHPGATWISAGMSQDLEQAVAAGATHLRIGTDVLGPRPDVG
ncbi:YggS family pyridoxal phosphate-dependent enzyme [Cellulosimicrobium funkei]|nr:YggS family pyridoxal phosphate-dependent enzyme [Cellulosimicrobium funkei]